MDIPSKIKAYINQNGIKQAYIADKTGIKRDALCTALNGKRSLPIDEYLRICIALNVPVTEFVEEHDRAVQA